MKMFALISAGTVENIIVAEAWPGGIDVTDLDSRPGPGWTYDGSAFTAPAPAPAPDPAPPAVQIPRDDFIERFTPAEWFDGQQRALTDANLAMGLALLMGKPDGQVTLTSPRVTRALGYMVVIGMLTQARAAEIGALP